MKPIDHNTQAREDWRQGVSTRMRISAQTGSVQLCMFDQWCDPGLGAPTHLHAVEEVLTCISGQAEVWVGDERHLIGPGMSVLVPAGRWHGYKNAAKQGILHMQATLAASIFEASYQDRSELSRRYVPA